MKCVHGNAEKLDSTAKMHEPVSMSMQINTQSFGRVWAIVLAAAHKRQTRECQNIETKRMRRNEKIKTNPLKTCLPCHFADTRAVNDYFLFASLAKFEHTSNTDILLTKKKEIKNEVNPDFVFCGR